jgi:hypothetical protein
VDRHLGTMLRELARLHMDHGFLRPGSVSPGSAKRVRLGRDRRSDRMDRRMPGLTDNRARVDRRRAA